MKQFSLRVLSVILSITLLAANFVTTITALDGIGLLGGEDSAKSETVTVTDAKIVAEASEPVFSALLKMTEPVKFGNAQIDFFPEGEAGYDAIKAMEAERNANGGVFNLCKEIDAYRKESNALKYLLANGENVKTVAR